MSATKLKAKIEEYEKTIGELNTKIQLLESSLEEQKKQSQNAIEAKDLEWQEKERVKTGEHDIKIKELNTEKEALENNLEETKSQLDRKELKKLAQAFDDEEKIHKINQRNWLIALIIAAVLLIGYAIFSIFLTTNKPWLDRIGYYAIDIILLSAVWFCSSQFSEETRLRCDYGNRKTLAQSFHNILNNLSEDSGIKSKFIEKTTDVLCASVGSGGKEPILTKKVLKDVAEIVGAAKGN